MDIAETSDCADAHRAFAQALRIRIGAIEQQMRELSSMRSQLVDLAVESDAGCTDALCLCRTHPMSAPKALR
jgi:hypothetical protein